MVENEPIHEMSEQLESQDIIRIPTPQSVEEYMLKI